MPMYTKTGKMTNADRPRRRGLFERIYRGAWLGYLFNNRMNPFGLLVFWRAREIEERLDQKENAEPAWHGIPDAELSDAVEHEAQRKLSREWHRE